MVVFRQCEQLQTMKPEVEKTRNSLVRRAKWSTLTSGLGILALILSGCATPIGVDYVDRSVAHHSLTANVLSTEKPSSFSARELMNRNLYQRFEEDPKGALAELHAGLAPEEDEDLLFALAELSFFHAEKSGDRSYYLAAAVYAYAILFPGPGNEVAIDPVERRYRLVYDPYNLGPAPGPPRADRGEPRLPPGPPRPPV